MLISRHQSAGQNHNLNKTIRSFENVAKLRYLGTTITIGIAFVKKLRAD
jgi:hypothetical protein